MALTASSISTGGARPACGSTWSGRASCGFMPCTGRPILLSAGLPLPTDILVHDYLTIDGRKISKSAATPAC